MGEARKPRHQHPATGQLEEMRARVERARTGGGPEAAARQHAAGKLTARERLDLLLDEDSFEETDLLVHGAEGRSYAGDGVVAGFGRVGGRPVCAYAHDYTVWSGTMGVAQAHKICKVLDLAFESGLPVLSLCDSAGARLEEGVDSLGGYGEIFHRHVAASGHIPQLCAILGPCAGGAVYAPALHDFVFMVDGISHMYLTAPELVAGVGGEACDPETLGGAAMHSSRSGVCHFLARSEPDCFRQMRELLDYLPQNWRERAKPVMPSDDPRRPSEVLGALTEMDPKKPYRICEVIWEIADGHQFLEVHKEFARNIVTGFIRLNGESVGVVANNPAYLSGALDISASEKAARFVRFCDCFNIPLLTLVDVPGYWPGLEQEYNGIIRKGAKLVYAYCQSSVPKVTVVLRKAYGGAYEVMGSKHIRGDVNFAWPSAEIAVMGPARAVEVLHAERIRAAADPEAERRCLVDDYVRDYASPYQAARRGYIDEVIDARQTRSKVIRALQFLRQKQGARIPKKHGNIPF
ncbi:MAG: acyl-CoA carboxylase subunit beta [Elusimicrobia bacterium]|nr:acyl-CoA carboxylase subunit beta [Elusimicrobiota bacterium]